MKMKSEDTMLILVYIMDRIEKRGLGLILCKHNKGPDEKYHSDYNEK